jgi:glucose-1-phosphate cytidylyltransferase
MKAVILAGGRGTRLSEETVLRPKPMVEIGGRPILWHIMSIYATQGVDEFVICLGYKGFVIKEYFFNYHLHARDFSVDLGGGQLTFHSEAAQSWRVSLIDTGDATQTGGRLKRIASHVQGDCFFMTYGDAVADIDLGRLLAFHRGHGKLATVTAVRPPGRFGALVRDEAAVTAFVEKPTGDGGTISGGFFVLSPRVFERIVGDDTVFEGEPLESLARDRELMAYDHGGFWQPMDTIRDKEHLESLWNSGNAPWKMWR